MQADNNRETWSNGMENLPAFSQLPDEGADADAGFFQNPPGRLISSNAPSIGAGLSGYANYQQDPIATAGYNFFNTEGQSTYYDAHRLVIGRLGLGAPNDTFFSNGPNHSAHSSLPFVATGQFTRGQENLLATNGTVNFNHTLSQPSHFDRRSIAISQLRLAAPNDVLFSNHPSQSTYSGPTFLTRGHFGYESDQQDPFATSGDPSSVVNPDPLLYSYSWPMITVSQPYDQVLIDGGSTNITDASFGPAGGNADTTSTRPSQEPSTVAAAQTLIPIPHHHGNTRPNTIRQRVSCGRTGCNKTFSRPADRDRHDQSVHRQVPTTHLCPVTGCGKTYSRADKVKEHLWKKHAALGYQKAT